MPGAKPQIPWTTEEDAALKALCVDRTLSWAEIAKQTGRSPSAASNRATRLGFIVSDDRQERRPWTPERIAEAGRLWAEGVSRKEIARRLKTNPHVIAKLRAQYGWQKRPVGKRSAPHYEYTRILRLMRSTRRPMTLLELVTDGDNKAARQQIYRLLAHKKIERVGEKSKRPQSFVLAAKELGREA